MRSIISRNRQLHKSMLEYLKAVLIRAIEREGPSQLWEGHPPFLSRSRMIRCSRTHFRLSKPRNEQKPETGSKLP